MNKFALPAIAVLLTALALLSGCAPAERASQPATYQPVSSNAYAPIVPAGTAMKVLDKRPPLTSALYFEAFGEPPPKLMIVPSEPRWRYFAYLEGSLAYWRDDLQVMLPVDPQDAATPKRGDPGPGKPDRPGNGKADNPGEGKPDKPGEGKVDNPGEARR